MKKLGVLILTLSTLVLTAACASSGPNSPQPDNVGHDDTTGEAPTRTTLSKVDHVGHDDTTGEPSLRSTVSTADYVGHDDTTGESSVRGNISKAERSAVPSQPASAAAQTTDPGSR